MQEEALSPFSEQTNLINDINSFLSKNEIFSSTTKNIECSDRYIEGSFRINRDYLVEESLISSMNLWTLENNSSNHSTISPDLIEKWFPGDHSDIGGGVFSTTNGQVISNLSLRWMLGEAIKHGVKFKPGSINKFNEKYTSMGSLFSCVHDFLNIKKAGIIIGELNKGVKTKDVVGLEEIQTFETYLSDNYCLNEENKQVCQKISINGFFFMDFGIFTHWY